MPKKLACLFVGLSSALAAADTWNLTADFSDLTNPFGQWGLYKNPTSLFGINQSNWLAGHPAWADHAIPDFHHVPVWLKGRADNYFGPGTEFLEGQVIMHSAESWRTGTDYSSAEWISPIAGTVFIHGGVWYAHSGAGSRIQRWFLSKNGVMFTDGYVDINDGTSPTNLEPFSAGSGGPVVVAQTVAIGDTIRFTTEKQGTFGAFVGIEMAITTSPNPGMLSGNVELQDFIGDPNGTPITVEIRRADGQMAVGRSYSTLDSSGNFSVPVLLEGTYTVGVKAKHWLRQAQQVVIAQAGATGLQFSLINGDTDGNNGVDLLDYDIFSAYFDKVSSDSDWSTVGGNGFAPKDADLDGNDAVDLLDYDIFSKNFDTVGD